MSNKPMIRVRRLLTLWVIPPLLFSWEVAFRPMPWTSTYGTITFAVMGVAVIPVTVYLRESGRASARTGYWTLVVLSLALAASMLYWKSSTLPFFNGIVAVGYSLLVTSNINWVRAVLAMIATGAAIIAMNVSGVIRAFALVVSCVAAVWLVRIWPSMLSERSFDDSESGRDSGRSSKRPKPGE